MQRTTQVSECLHTAKSTETRFFAHAWHLDLAGQGPADIQMLYYYITGLPKKQALFRIFFNPLKNGLFLPPDLWKNTALQPEYGKSTAAPQSEPPCCMFCGITPAPVRRPDMYLRRRRTRDMRPHQSHTCRRPQRSRRPDMHLHMHRTGCKHR